MSVQRPLPLKLDQANRFDRFLAVGNEAVFRRLQAVASQSDQQAVWLFLHGPSGSGKTHLLQAAAQAWSTRHGRALYLPLGNAGGWQPEALQGLLGVGLYCLDNLQDIAGDADWERAVFALLNRVRDEQAQLIMASARPLPALEIALPDLRSRLAWGEQLGINLPDDNALADLLALRAKQQGITLDERALRYLLQRLERNPAALTRALHVIGEYSLSARRRITLPLIREALARESISASQGDTP